MSLTPSGKYDAALLQAQHIGSIPNYDYCGSSTSADAYPATAPSETTNNHAFGFLANTIIIINESANDLAYQWPRLYSGALDSGVVKGNSTLVIRNAVKDGIKFRSRVASSPAAYVVTAV